MYFPGYFPRVYPLRIVTVVAFLFLLHLDFTFARYEHVCTEDGLYTPYVHVYEGRKGNRIIDAGPGFVELANKVDIYVCVNGPAYLYFSKNNTFGEVFDTPEFSVFSHMCGLYNKSPRRGHSHSSTRKLMGVLLMGTPTDYRLPSIQLFAAPTYNYDTDVYENGTSVITYGNKLCYLEKKDLQIIIKPPDAKDPDKPEYCVRPFNEDGAKKEEEDALRADAPIRVISCDPPTPPAAKGTTIEIEVKECEVLPGIDDECAKGQPEKDYVCKVFQAMLGKTEPGWKKEDEWKQVILELIGEIFSQSCTIVSSRLPKAVNRLLAFYIVNAPAKSAGAPSPGPSPPPSGPSPSPPPTGPSPSPGPAPVTRKKRSAQLGDSNRIKRSPGPPSSGGSPSSGSPSSGSPSSGSPSSLSPSSGSPSSGGGAPAGPPPPPPIPVGPGYWKHVFQELQDCLEAKTKLYFKEQIVGGSRTKTFYKNGKTPIPIVHFVEEAENEYEFNWAIDMHWKIFATVLGVCTTGGQPRTSSMASMLYSLYVEDFLSPINSTWIEFKDNLIFEVILSEFYGKDSETWVQDCLEASFIETNSQDYRPIRPLLVGDLREDNYFLGGPFEQPPSSGGRKRRSVRVAEGTEPDKVSFLDGPAD